MGDERVAPKPRDLAAVLSKAGAKALGGGLPGALAMVVQVWQPLRANALPAGAHTL